MPGGGTYLDLGLDALVAVIEVEGGRGIEVTLEDVDGNKNNPG